MGIEISRLGSCLRKEGRSESSSDKGPVIRRWDHPMRQITLILLIIFYSMSGRSSIISTWRHQSISNINYSPRRPKESGEGGA